MVQVKNFFANANKNALSLFAIALAVTIIMGSLAPKTFLSAENFQSMCIQFAEYGILAFGMMIAIISG